MSNTPLFKAELYFEDAAYEFNERIEYVTYSGYYNRAIPGVWTLSNGDPGYPDEPAYFELEEVFNEDGVNIIDTLSAEHIEQLTESGYKECEKEIRDYRC